MKPSKTVKKTKLSKAQIKRGIFINRIQRVEEVAYRKLNLDVLKKVAFARKPVIVTDYGKQLALILPLAER